MKQPILILGGGPAGLAAAHALARVGQQSILVDKADSLGGAPILSGYAKLVPSGEWAKDAIGGMVQRVAQNKQFVEVHTGTTAKNFSGARGEFTAELSDGRKPQRVAILLCVGSRDRQIGREWCSKICCTVSCNIAMEIREELPDCHVYIYYMDIRTFGLLEQKYYWRSQEEFKVKYIKARIAEVTSNGQKLIVKGEDTLVKRPITIPFDMVVHAIGMDPNVDNRSLASVFGIALQPQGFIGKTSTYATFGETSRPGIFVAGAATGPETIDDSIAQGKAAAIAAYAVVNGARVAARAA